MALIAKETGVEGDIYVIMYYYIRVVCGNETKRYESHQQLNLIREDVIGLAFGLLDFFSSDFWPSSLLDF